MEGRNTLHSQLRTSPLATNINLYRCLAIARAVLYALLFRHRLLPLCSYGSAPPFWLPATLCELVLVLLWLLSQSTCWFSIDRQTFPERLPHTSLPPVDVFVTTADPSKEPPIITMNTVLSVLAMDYPHGGIACYVSDDAASPLTFWALVETSRFADRWVRFCKRFEVEPRVPDLFFRGGKGKCRDSKESEEYEHTCEAIEKEYSAFKHVVNEIAAGKSMIPEDILSLLEGLTEWPACDPKNHGPIFKAILHNGAKMGSAADAVPSLFYISREKKPHYSHRFKAGAMNSLVRVSGVVTNSPFILNLDCDNYVSNPKALRHAMCFFMDSIVERHLSFVQFPQCFYNIHQEDIYGNRLKMTFDVTIAGMDGIQGPVYCGTGCIQKRETLYGSIYDSQLASNINTKLSGSPDHSHYLMSYEDLRNRFGNSHVFASSVRNTYNQGVKFLEASSQEIMELMSCEYEKGTEWGNEVGLIYGSILEDVLTGLKRHGQGYRSIFCRPYPVAFIGSAPTNGPDNFRWRMRGATGMLETIFTRYSPFFFTRATAGLMFLQRAAYLSFCLKPLHSVIFTYSALQALCLIRAAPLIPKIWDPSFALFSLLFISLYLNTFIQSRWLEMDVTSWWNDERMNAIGEVSSSLFAVLEVLMKLAGLSETVFVITPKKTEEEKTAENEQSGSFTFDESPLFITPTALAILNAIAVMVGISRVLKGGSHAFNVLFGQIFCCCWACFYLRPFLRGIMTTKSAGRLPFSTILKAAILAGLIIAYGIL